MSTNTNTSPKRRGPMGKGVPGEKAKDFKGAMQKLISFCKPFAVVIIIALICDMLSVITRLIGPNKISDITNLITEGLTSEIDLDGIISICVFLAVLYVIGAVLNYVTGLIMTIVTQKVNRGLRDSISKKINRLPVSYFHGTTAGDVLSRVTNDVDTIGQTLQRSIASLISAITMFVGSIIMMTYTNWIMSLTAIVSSIFGFAFMLVIMKRSQKYFIARQKWLGEMNGHVEEIYTGRNIVKLFNSEKRKKKNLIFLTVKCMKATGKASLCPALCSR